MTPSTPPAGRHATASPPSLRPSALPGALAAVLASRFPREFVPQTRDERIEHIADLMRRWAWVRAKTAKELARAWGLSPRTVEDLAAQARRVITLESTGDLEHVRGKAAAAAEWVLDQAIARGELGMVLKASTAYANLTGAAAARKVAMTVDVSGMSAEEHVRALEELEKQASEEAARVRAEAEAKRGGGDG